jgi:hypothetical protein
MAYIYQTVFDIRADEVSQIQVGKSLGQSLAYLKAFLPNETGFITSRAMVSMSQEEKTHLVLESNWEDWESLEMHLKNSPFAEHKILSKFDLKVTPQDIKTFIYEEVG